MHRSFAFPDPLDSDDALDPITFDIEGEKFTCIAYRALPAGAMYAIGRRQDSPVVRCVEFLRLVLADADEEARFLALLNRRGSRLDDVTLAQIVNYLTEAYAERPTQRSSGSAPGPRLTTATSPDGSTSPASDGASGANSPSPTG